MPARSRRGVGARARPARRRAPTDDDATSDDDDGSSTSQTTLFGAIEDGDREAFERALRDDPTSVADVNSNGWTAAHQAAYSGEDAMLRRVLELGVDVNAPCNDGCLAVHYASAQGEKKCLRVLSECGSAMETKDRDGETPLDVCTRGARELLADLIVDARRRARARDDAREA